MWVYPPISGGGGGGGGGITDVTHDATLSGAGTSGSPLTVVFGTSAGTSAQGNDSRITGALQTPGSSAQGDILYRNATTWTRLGAGTSGYLLQTNGAGADPSWVAPPPSGALMSVATSSPVSGDGTVGNPVTVSVGTTAGTVAAGNDSRIVGAVQTTRQVIAGTGLSGGGTLAADRTFAVVYGTTAGTAAQGDDTRITGAVPSSRTVTAGTGLSGGGDLSANRSFAVVYGITAEMVALNSAAAQGSVDKAARIDHVHAFPTAANVGAIPAPGGPGQGDILYYNGSAWTELTPGTAGYRLQTNGVGATPTWVAMPTSLPPSGSAGGDLTGTYPSPTIANNAVTAAKIANATITDTQVATANIDGIAATASLRTLGTGSQQALPGSNDALYVKLAGTQTVTGAKTFSAAASFTDGTSPIISAKAGPTSGQQHTIPAVSSDTFALLAASQTFTNKTLTSPVINVSSDAQGDVYYRNSSGAFTRLAAGTSGKALITGGAGADPSWAYPQTVGSGTGAVLYQGGGRVQRTATATNYTATTSDYLIAVTSTASARTITLPDAAPVGTVYIVVDESGAAGTNNITVSRNSTSTINGATTYVISLNYGKASFYSDGTNWFVLGG